jgi:hypothetical protein
MIWESNLNFIEKHNLAADRGEHTFWVGMNEYGDMVRLSSITRGAYVLGWHERVWRYGKAIFYNPLSVHLGWHERLWRYGKAIFYNQLSIHLDWHERVCRYGKVIFFSPLSLVSGLA